MKRLETFFSKRDSKIYVFGDSHSRVFKYINRTYEPRPPFGTVIVEGGTAMGMVNPNSKTNCLGIFLKEIRNVPKSSKIYFWLGEVDTGFVIWYRSEKYGNSINDQVHQSIGNYFSFIDEVIKLGYKKISVISVLPPTIADGVPMGHVSNLLKEVKATQLERTKLTGEYNNELYKECKVRGLDYVDLEKSMVGASGVIKKKFLNKDPKDHHCDNRSLSELIIKELKINSMMR